MMFPQLIGMMFLFFLCPLPAFCGLLSPLNEDIGFNHAKRTENGLHIPLIPSYRKQKLDKRAESGTSKLGDYFDLVYTVIVTIGSIATPVDISTGSADLWVISENCKSCNASGVPFYPQTTFEPADLDISIMYGGGEGDSESHTISGTIGRDTVGLAGFDLPNQYFAAINTTTQFIGLAAAGAFGLGWPGTSLIWHKVVSRDVKQMRASGKTIALPDAIYDSYQTSTPLIVRMVANKFIKEPMFTFTLQRTTVELTGRTPGLLSIGEFPEGVRNDSFHWVPIKKYPVENGGLPPSASAPAEVYPSTWEVFIDDVYFDGKLLPRSKLTPPGLAITAMVDVGSVNIRGPADIIAEIRTQMGGTGFPCGEPHTLAFKIGGVVFPVDPRDLINSPDRNPDIFPYSWTLGAPFLRGVVASFYYGNIQRPSLDQPRIGFISRVPVNAADLLKKAVASGTLPYTTDELTDGVVFPGQNTSTTITPPPPAPTASVDPKRGSAFGHSAFYPSTYAVTLCVTLLLSLPFLF